MYSVSCTDDACYLALSSQVASVPNQVRDILPLITAHIDSRVFFCLYLLVKTLLCSAMEQNFLQLF